MPLPRLKRTSGAWASELASAGHTVEKRLEEAGDSPSEFQAVMVTR